MCQNPQTGSIQFTHDYVAKNPNFPGAGTGNQKPRNVTVKDTAVV